MKQMSVHEARAHFSSVLKDVEAGEVIIITRHDKPILEMRSVVDRPTPKLGVFAESSGAHLEVSWSEGELQDLFGDL